MNRGEIKTEIFVRSGRDTTSAWLSNAYVNNWINQAQRWAGGYKPWPYTEGRAQTTYTTANETWSFEGYKADSFRFIEIGGKRYQKLNFEDYQIFKENQPANTDRVYSNFGSLVYVNVAAGGDGTLVAYGQYQPANITDDDTDTVFTPDGDEGNEAIIEEVVGKIANRESNPQEAINKHLIAKQSLDDLWTRIEDEQFAYQTKNRGQYKWFDVIDRGRYGGYYNSFNRDRWY